MINWADVDTVLLDMDGTVLDLHFDNRFWSHLLPERYGALHGLDTDAARSRLFAHFDRTRHTLEFYCLDHWSQLTGLDVIALKQELAHLIDWRPGSLAFIEAVRDAGKQVLLVTNAHRGSLDVKHARTALLDHFHAHVSSHDFGAAKEDARFWAALREQHPHDPGRTLLVDDNVTVLDSARDAGIAHLISIDQPDSRAARREGLPYPSVTQLDELL